MTPNEKAALTRTITHLSKVAANYRVAIATPGSRPGLVDDLARTERTIEKLKLRRAAAR